MDKKLEQRAVIKSFALADKPARDAVDFLQKAYKDQALNRSKIYRWHKRFMEGRKDVKDDERPGRPREATSKDHVEVIDRAIQRDRRISCEELGKLCNISSTSAHRIVHTILGKRYVSSRWVPHILTEEQKKRRVALAKEFLAEVQHKGKKYLKNIITADETIVYFFDPETKHESMMWKSPSSPSLQKARRTRSQKKMMFIIFYDADGVILCHAVPIGRTVSADYYCKVRYYFLLA